jgi:hypothetical protein
MIPKFVRRGMIGFDSYTRAYPEPEPYLEQDLFAGVH